MFRRHVALNDFHQTLVVFALGAEVVPVTERVVGVNFEVFKLELERAQPRLELEARIVCEQKNRAAWKRVCNVARRCGLAAARH